MCVSLRRYDFIVKVIKNGRREVKISWTGNHVSHVSQENVIKGLYNTLNFPTRVVFEGFLSMDKTMQKLSAKLSGVLMASLKGGNPRQPPCSPPLIFTPDYVYIIFFSIFQIVPHCIVVNGIFGKYYYCTSHWPVLYVALPFWYFQNNLARGAKPGVLSPDLRYSKLCGFIFFFWRSEVFRN